MAADPSLVFPSSSNQLCPPVCSKQLFYQVKGDMCLKVVENGKHKDVHIREGEVS